MKMQTNKIRIIGGGLAGCECAYQLLKRGYSVEMYEMRPTKQTQIHKTGLLAELVCSNSLKSTDPYTSQGLLKYELRALDSLILRCAETDDVKVPAGGALAVDRNKFASSVEEKLKNYERLRIIREECIDIDDDGFTVIASGPLTSDELSRKIGEITSVDGLHFYDAVAPIITADSVDMKKAFYAGRYGKGGDDYLNCPMTKEEYYSFCNELIGAETVILKDFEDKEVFNACLPIEIMAKKGAESMRFGPLRPVGISVPGESVRPYAVVQLRKEDNYENLLNIVGFQTNLKFGEQKRVFSMIPGLENAEFVRYGVMHRNTFIDAPKVLNSDFSCKNKENVYFAGQISGVEGYLESAMSGLMTAICIDRRIKGKNIAIPSENTATGSLMRYITSENKNFQPMHVSYSLMPALNETIKDKKIRKEKYSLRAMADIDVFAKKISKE